MHAMKNSNITARPSTHAEQLFAAQAAIRERASRAFGRNIKTSKTADKKSNLPSIEETFPQQYVDLKDDISLAYSLETQSGSHIATLSHKNHGPSLRVAHSFCGQPIPTVYTVDPQGRCWVNLLDPQNKHMFREFIIAANDSDLMILANNAPEVLNDHRIRDCLVNTQLAIPHELLSKLAVAIPEKPL